MGKKKKDKANKKQTAGNNSPDKELDRLRKENAQLRARLQQIAELVGAPYPPPHDEEDEEYDELSRDVDDEIADDESAAPAKPGSRPETP